MKNEMTIQQLESKAHWNSADVAFFLGCSRKTFTGRIKTLPDFPTPYRWPCPTGGKGDPRWKPEEIKAWFEKQKEPKAA